MSLNCFISEIKAVEYLKIKLNASQLKTLIIIKFSEQKRVFLTITQMRKKVTMNDKIKRFLSNVFNKVSR